MCAAVVKAFALAVLLSAVASQPTFAVELDPKAVTFQLPDQIKCGPVDSGGAKQAVLFGDPAKPGQYGVMVRWTAGNHFSGRTPIPMTVSSPYSPAHGGSAAVRPSIPTRSALPCRPGRLWCTTPIKCIGTAPMTVTGKIQKFIMRQTVEQRLGLKAAKTA